MLDEDPSELKQFTMYGLDLSDWLYVSNSLCLTALWHHSVPGCHSIPGYHSIPGCHSTPGWRRILGYHWLSHGYFYDTVYLLRQFV